MTNYVKSTNFASKDSLASGNPLKIVKGTEIDTEFNNIATSVATKSDINSPVFTGVPEAPTAAAGTNTTQLATTAFVTAALQALYPVGSIYINASSSTNPATLLGFGTWASVGDGKVLVNQDTADTAFDTLGETGGSKDAIVVSHTHSFSATTSGQSADHTHVGGNTTEFGTGTVSASGYSSNSGVNSLGKTYVSSGTSNDHTHSVSGTTGSTGSSGTNANLQPYVVVKMWKRTA